MKKVQSVFIFWGAKIDIESRQKNSPGLHRGCSKPMRIVFGVYLAKEISDNLDTSTRKRFKK